jgi:predicted AlkP superfamily pyrophosphatase or phosphodiesterase
MKDRHFIIVSFDALSNRDLKHIEELPGFKKLMDYSSYCLNVSSVYPSLTYPCHTSISTGMYPKNHGVESNTLLQLNRSSPDWNWTRDKIKTDTFYDAALRKGLTVCSLLWPVTGKSKITWNLPEIFPNRPWKHQIPVTLLNGTPIFLMDINRRFGYLRNGIKQPQLDLFVEAASHYMLKTKKPNVLMMHYVELDAMRHIHGYDSKEAQTALRSYDQKLQNLFNVLEEEKLLEKTTLFVLGDHDQIPVDTAIHMNSIFKDKGYLTVKNGKIRDYEVYCQSLDGSAYLYFGKNVSDTRKMEIRKLLQRLRDRKDFGIESVHEKERMLSYGAGRKADLMLEAKRGFYFHDAHDRPALVKQDEHQLGTDHHGKSTHGFDPQKKDYQTVFFASGKGIKQGIVLPSMCLVDEGPTFAYAMGTVLHDTDGRILSEIFDDPLI